MKKTVYLLFIAAALTLAGCAQKQSETANGDTPNTPVLLVGFDKMFQIQAEANLFFQTMGTMIDNLFANEKPNSENGTVIDHYLGTVTQEMLEDYALGLGISLETALFLVNQYRRMSGVSELDRALFDL